VFIAEGRLVVRRLLTSRFRTRSLLLTAPAHEALAGDLADRPGVPVFLAPQTVMDSVAGFNIHRGCLAIGERPPPASVPRAARAVVVLEDLTDVDNLGALARHAAAFGADALMLSPRCADPFYRKAVRVSLGAVFSLPIVRASRWPDDLAALRRDGFALVAAVVEPGAIPLASLRPPDRFALVLGAEGPGLSAAARDACDHRVTIPMSPGADSLNVATAGAIFLYALMRSRSS